MNVSMQDGFNLGWKLAVRAAQAVRATPAAHLFGGTSGHRQGADRLRSRMGRSIAVHRARRASTRPRRRAISSSTAATRREPRPAIGPRCSPARRPISIWPQGFAIGMRFHSAPVIRLADAKPVQLGHTVKADGRWRIFAFAGAEDPAAPTRASARCAIFCREHRNRLCGTYTAGERGHRRCDRCPCDFPAGASRPRDRAMPSLLLPRKGRYGLRDYEKMFCADLKSGNDIFAMRGIDRERGCMVVVRPDQFVAHVLPLDGYAELAAFFDGFMTRGTEREAIILSKCPGSKLEPSLQFAGDSTRKGRFSALFVGIFTK